MLKVIIFAYCLQISLYNFTGEAIVMAKWYCVHLSGSFIMSSAFFVYTGKLWTVLEWCIVDTNCAMLNEMTHNYSVMFQVALRICGERQGEGMVMIIEEMKVGVVRYSEREQYLDMLTQWAEETGDRQIGTTFIHVIMRPQLKVVWFPWLQRLKLSKLKYFRSNVIYNYFYYIPSINTADFTPLFYYKIRPDRFHY